MDILPYAYALLVFAIVAFLFVLLGRIFLNIQTEYYYEFEVVTKDAADDSFAGKLVEIIEKRGKDGWRYERNENVLGYGVSKHLVLLIFVKSKNKIKLF